MKLPFSLYRVKGKSMLPTLPSGKLVLARQWFIGLKPGQLVVIHHQGLDKIKRLRDIHGDKIFVTGDNATASTDSRQFGWLPVKAVVGKVTFTKLLGWSGYR